MDGILISIVIPVYNSGDLLKMCVESLMNQTAGNIEAVFVDDGSTDGSTEYLDSVASYPRFRVVHKKNGGVQSARREGLMHVSGNYITFMDGDDMIALNAYEECTKTIKKYDPDLCMFRYRSFYARDKHPEKEPMVDARYTLLGEKEIRDNFMAGAYLGGYLWNKIWKREMLRELDFRDDFQISEDSVYVWDSLKHVRSAVIIEKPFYQYRIVQTSMTNQNSVKNYMLATDAWDHLQAETEKIGCLSCTGVGRNKIHWVLMAARAVVQAKGDQSETKAAIRRKLQEARKYLGTVGLRERFMYRLVMCSWPAFSAYAKAYDALKQIKFRVKSR